MVGKGMGVPDHLFLHGQHALALSPALQSFSAAYLGLIALDDVKDSNDEEGVVVVLVGTAFFSYGLHFVFYLVARCQSSSSPFFLFRFACP